TKIKSKPRTNCIFAALITFGALFASTIASSTTLVRMSVAQMTQAAQLVVRVRCVSNSTAWDAGEIWTFTSFAVEETWKGSQSASSNSVLTVRLLGGTIGNLTSTVSGIPRFVPGEDVILFLEPTTRSDYSVVSWIQGTFRIRRDPRSGGPLAMQDTASFDTFDRAARQFHATGLHNIAVEDLRSLVSAAIATDSNRIRGVK
ncbi:MAG TPA: hypothetical protein VIH97_12315, partial [Candidatus Acidoferrales bacterium]